MKVVLDRNAVISALLHQGSTRRFPGLWRLGKIEPLASQAMLDEYVRVLHYPKFGYGAEVIAGILKENLFPWVAKVEEHPVKLRYPPKDGSGENFLRAGLNGKARALVSGDPHLTALDGKYPFPILPSGRFLAAHFGKEN